jgi:hypothetical protein
MSHSCMHLHDVTCLIWFVPTVEHSWHSFERMLIQIQVPGGMWPTHLSECPEACMFSTILATSEKYTYIEFNTRRYPCHAVAAAWALQFLDKADQSRAQGTEASHLCNNPSCINPKHVVFEYHVVNLSRELCFHKMLANDPLFECPHKFKCIRHDPTTQVHLHNNIIEQI